MTSTRSRIETATSTDDTPTRVRLTLVSLGLLSAMVFALIVLAALVTGRLRYGYLLWNLVLALVPVGLALGVRYFTDRGRSRVALALGLSWLLFLPNSPYILTDFIHLTQTPRAWAWGHLLLLVWTSFTALLAGLLSLRWIHDIVARRFGATAGWSFVALVSLLSGLGVALGRFGRWNSWDAFFEPERIVSSALRHVPLVAPPTMEVILPWGLGLFFGLSYLVLWTQAAVLSPARPRPNFVTSGTWNRAEGARGG